MDVTFHIPPDLEQGLLAQARAEGLSVEALLEALVRRYVNTPETGSPSTGLSSDQWMRKFHAWLDSNAGNTVVLPDDAMERESIYGDHGR